MTKRELPEGYISLFRRVDGKVIELQTPSGLYWIAIGKDARGRVNAEIMLPKAMHVEILEDKDE